MDRGKWLEVLQNKPSEHINVFEPGRKKPIHIIVNNIEYPAALFPETFKIPEEGIRKMIPVGMMVKIIIETRSKYSIPDRIWVEVTNISHDREGQQFYLGVLRNDTLVGSYGSLIGPFYPRNICDFDIDAFIEKHNLKLAA